MLARSAQVLATRPSSQCRFDISASQASQQICVEARSGALRIGGDLLLLQLLLLPVEPELLELV